MTEKLLAAAAVATGVVAAALWTVFGLHRTDEIAVSAAGATMAFLLSIAATRIGKLTERVRHIDDELAAAGDRLTDIVARESRDRGVEFERTLARARADSASLLS